MTNYSTDIGGAQTGFQSVSSVTPKRDSTAKQSAFLDLASKFAGGVAKGYAVGSAKDAAGADQSYAEVESGVSLFDEAIDKAKANRPDGTPPASEAELMDIRAKAIDDLDLTTRQIKSLVANNKISSTEAQARVDKELSDRLSNPFLAMYEADFRNTVSQYTGDIGLSADEKQAQIVAAAREAQEVELQETKAAFMVDRQLTDAEAEKQARTLLGRNSNINYLNKQKELNGHLAVADYRTLATDSSDQMREKASAIFTQNLVDGRLDPKGVNEIKALTSAWALNLQDAIAKSDLSKEDKDVEMNNIKTQLSYIDAIYKNKSMQEFYANVSETSGNYLAAEMLKNYPIVSWAADRGLTEMAEVLFMGGDEAKDLYRGMNIPIDAFAQLSKSTDFPGGMQLKLTEAAVKAAKEGDTETLEKMAGSPEAAAELQQKAAFISPSSAMSPVNTRAIVAGDEAAIANFEIGVKSIRDAISGQAFDNYEIGEIKANPVVPSSGNFGLGGAGSNITARPEDKKWAPQNVKWENFSNGIDNQQPQIKAVYNVAYQYWLKGDAEVRKENPPQIWKRLMTGGGLLSPEADPKYDNPDNRAVSDVGRNKKLQDGVDRAKGALAGLTEDQLISEMESMNPGKLRDAIEAELSSRVEGGMNNG